MDQGDSTGLHRAIKYRPDIDGLRAIAITSVVIYHAGFSWAKGGFVGVDVFFVISGYLIGTLVYKEIRGGSFSIAKFYERRAKRILPALCVVLLFCYVMAFLILYPKEMKTFSGSALATITSTSNIYFWKGFNYFNPNTDFQPLAMTWSLGVEEQFYILFPLLMLTLRKVRWRVQFLCIGGLALLSFVGSIWGTRSHPTHTFFFLDTRAWELAVGVLLTMFESNRKSKVRLPAAVQNLVSFLGLGAIGIAVAFFSRNTPFPGYAAMLPVAGAALIIAAPAGVINRILSWKPIVFVGLVSYSWYLWHWPLLSFARITSYAGISTWTGASLALGSFGCAVLSYRFVELPFRKSASPTTVLLRRYGALAATLMVPAAILYATDGLPQRAWVSRPTTLRLEAAGNDLWSDQCMIHDPSKPYLGVPCVPEGRTKSVALIGDSHATALAGALRLRAAQSGYRLIELTKADCPPLFEVSPSYSAGNGFVSGGGFVQECSDFNNEELKYLVNDSSIRVVVIAGYWSRPLHGYEGGEGYTSVELGAQSVDRARSLALMESGLGNLVKRLGQADKVVYLLQDNPEYPFDPNKLMLTCQIRIRCAIAELVATLTPPSKPDVAPPRDSRESEEVRSVVAKVALTHPEVRVIDLQSALCSEIGCRFAQGDQALYVDDNHLSLLGAQIALTDLRFP